MVVGRRNHHPGSTWDLVLKRWEDLCDELQSGYNLFLMSFFNQFVLTIIDGYLLRPCCVTVVIHVPGSF